jgi:hypothetical protein
MLALAPIAIAAGANQPFIGVWKLNFAKSHLHASPGNEVYRQFKDDRHGWVSHIVITIGPQGTGFLYTAARYDGKPYKDYTIRSLGKMVREGATPAQTVTFNRLNAHQIRWTDRVNGKVVALGTETVSPDDKTLTIINQRPGQKMEQQVFDRVSQPGIPGS